MTATLPSGPVVDLDKAAPGQVPVADLQPRPDHEPAVDPAAPEAPDAPEARRRTRTFSMLEAGVLTGCAISSLLATWLLYYRLTPAAGGLGFLLVWYAAFLVLYYVVSREVEGRIAAFDRAVTAVVTTGAALLLLPLVWILTFVVVKGLPALRPSFFTQDQRGVLATDPSTAGGGLHAIVGTLEQVGIALVISLPLGVLTAVLLSETRSTMRRPVRIVVEAMSGLPSEVAGLFIYASLVLSISRSSDGGGGFSGIMASFALSLIMIPTITRTLDVVLRLVPDGLREASYALGASQARTVWSVVLPTARSGLATAIVLGVARAVGETAPLIFTTLGNSLMNWNPFSGQQDALPLFVYQRVRLQSAEVRERGFAGALVLLMIVVLLFLLVRFIGRARTRR